MAFFKNGKRSVSALLISYFTFSHSVCQNFFCDVNVDVLDAFAKEGSSGQERAGDVFSNESKTKKSVKRSIKEGESSGGLSSDDKSLTEGYLYLEKGKRGKTEDVKRGFIYLSSNGVEEGPQIEPFGKDASGKTHFTLKNAGSKYGENVEDSLEKSSGGDILSFNLESDESGISSTGSENASGLLGKGVNRKSEADGPLKVSAPENTGASKMEILGLKVNQNVERGNDSREGRSFFTDSVSSLGSTSDDFINFKSNWSVDFAKGTADKKEFIGKIGNSAEGEVSSAGSLVNSMDSLFSDAKEEKGSSRNIQANGGSSLLDLSMTNSSSSIKESTKISTKKGNKCLVLNKCGPSIEDDAVSLNSEKNCSLGSSVDCVKTIGNEVAVGGISGTKAEKPVFKIAGDDSGNGIKVVGDALISNENKDSLTLRAVKNEEGERSCKKCDNETCAPGQKNTGKDLANVADNFVGEDDSLNRKNTLDEGSNSKGLVRKEFFNEETGKGEKSTVVSSTIAESSKKDSMTTSILSTKKKVDTDDKEEEFLKGLVEEESWWSRWRKKLVLGMGALVTAAAGVYGVKKWILKDGKGIKSTFPYF